MSTSVVYPPNAAPALGLLTSHNNDIEVYVEDSSTPNLWVKLLKKYLPDNVRLNNVNVLGDKLSVIRACKHDQGIDGRKKLYIIDGDMELLLGRRKPKLRHLYRLRRYCVENYILDEDSIICAVTSIDPKIDEFTARQKIDYNGWVNRNSKALEKLFVCYGVVFELRNDLETVGYSVFKLKKDGDSGDLCEKKVLERTVGLYRSARAHFSREKTRSVFDKVQKSAKSLGVTSYVSGKDYIFPLVYLQIRRHCKLNITVNSFKVLVSQSVKKTNDPYLSRRIRSLLECR